MRYTVLFSIFIIFLFSCNKDKYTTAPQLKYKSANTTRLQRGQTLQLTLSFTDAEGDLTDKIFIIKTAKTCPAGNFVDSSNSIPTFPSGSNQSGEIIVSYDYNALNPLCFKSDTAIFKFVLRDKEKHLSDTAVSEPIVIIF